MRHGRPIQPSVFVFAGTSSATGVQFICQIAQFNAVAKHTHAQ
jgi:hypothetical protein